MSQPLRGRDDAARGSPATEERRQYERYPSAEDQAWLGWWEGRVYRRSPAMLIDISQGGAKVVSEIPPPRRSTIWMCIDGPRRTEWVEAEVVEVVRLDDGTAQVRMAFREVCPYAFFEVAVYGFPERVTATSARSATAAAAHRVGW
jgi:hypothetical protein